MPTSDTPCVSGGGWGGASPSQPLRWCGSACTPLCTHAGTGHTEGGAAMLNAGACATVQKNAGETCSVESVESVDCLSEDVSPSPTQQSCHPCAPMCPGAQSRNAGGKSGMPNAANGQFHRTTPADRSSSSASTVRQSVQRQYCDAACGSSSDQTVMQPAAVKIVVLDCCVARSSSGMAAPGFRVRSRAQERHLSILQQICTRRDNRPVRGGIVGAADRNGHEHRSQGTGVVRTGPAKAWHSPLKPGRVRVWGPAMQRLVANGFSGAGHASRVLARPPPPPLKSAPPVS